MKVLFGCGIRGMDWYRSLVEVGVVELVWGCCWEGGISGGDGGGLGVMLLFAVVLVGC